MVTERSTSDEGPRRARRTSRPGLVAVFAAGAPILRAIRLAREPTVLGRAHDAWRDLDDPKLSRAHAEAALADRGITVRDLDSRNGTFVAGERLGRAAHLAPFGAAVRLGRTVLLAVPDVLPFEDLPTLLDDDDALVLGPAMRRALDRVRLHGARNRTLLLRGETGTGKEVAARRFWAGGPAPRGPFIAVNCATIPPNLAERLLFGAVRGAYSGAETHDGYLHAADGGVLFLDELGELPADVQAKLLRTLETGEVTMLGDTRPRTVDVRFCFATHRDLRAAAGAGTFRPDLYYRVARPELVLPPLRDRPEEIAWLAARTCAAESATPTAALIEACLHRPWPGNVRELLAAIRDACTAAASAGAPDVTDDHLASDAGLALAPAAPAAEPTRTDLERALADAGGNIAHAARALGLHRTQLYRLLARHGIR